MKKTKLFLSLALAACVATLSLSRCTTNDDGFAPKTDAPRSEISILAEYVSLDDMQYSLDITEAEAEALGVDLKAYNDLVFAIQTINADVQKELAVNPETKIYMHDPNQEVDGQTNVLMKSRTEKFEGVINFTGGAREDGIWNVGGPNILKGNVLWIGHGTYVPFNYVAIRGVIDCHNGWTGEDIGASYYAIGGFMEFNFPYNMNPGICSLKVSLEALRGDGSGTWDTGPSRMIWALVRFKVN